MTNQYSNHTLLEKQESLPSGHYLSAHARSSCQKHNN